MPDSDVALDVKELRLSAVVIRCACGAPTAHAGAPCPQGVAQDLGTIAYHSSNPLRQLVWRLRRRLNGGRA